MKKQDFVNVYNSSVSVLDNFCNREGRLSQVAARQELIRLSEIIKMVESLLAEKGKLELLEIGIGFSLVTSALRSVFSSDVLKISTVDHPDVPHLARDDFMNHLIRTEVSLKSANICEQALPYDDSTFDVVVFSETIEHLPQTKVPAVLSEISRILKQNGIAIISTPNLAAWQFRWKLMRGKHIFDPAIPLDWAGGTYAHIRLYTPDEVGFLLEHVGLRTINVKYLNFGINNKNIFKRAILKSIYFLVPSLAPDFFIFAKKI